MKHEFYIGQRFMLAGILYEVTEIKDEPEDRFYFISESDGNGFWASSDWLNVYLNTGRILLYA